MIAPQCDGSVVAYCLFKNLKVREGAIAWSNGRNGFIYNNIIYGTLNNGDSSSHSGIYCYEDTGTTKVYNNTVYGGQSTGIVGNSKVVLKNNISYGNATDYSGTVNDTSTNNLASDTSTPEYNTYYDSKTITFVDAANGDFHLASTDTDAIDKGADLSGEAIFTDNIDGTTRTGTWDIGADEYINPIQTNLILNNVIINNVQLN